MAGVFFYTQNLTSHLGMEIKADIVMYLIQSICNGFYMHNRVDVYT